MCPHRLHGSRHGHWFPGEKMSTQVPGFSGDISYPEEKSVDNMVSLATMRYNVQQ